MRPPTHVLGRTVVVGLVALVAGVGTAAAQSTPLTIVFTPSRDPTALKEAADAFAKTLTEISGVPVRGLVASD